MSIFGKKALSPSTSPEAVAVIDPPSISEPPAALSEETPKADPEAEAPKHDPQEWFKNATHEDEQHPLNVFSAVVTADGVTLEEGVEVEQFGQSWGIDMDTQRLLVAQHGGALYHAAGGDRKVVTRARIVRYGEEVKQCYLARVREGAGFHALISFDKSTDWKKGEGVHRCAGRVPQYGGGKTFVSLRNEGDVCYAVHPEGVTICFRHEDGGLKAESLSGVEAEKAKAEMAYYVFESATHVRDEDRRPKAEDRALHRLIDLIENGTETLQKSALKQFWKVSKGRSIRPGVLRRLNEVVEKKGSATFVQALQNMGLRIES